MPASQVMQAALAEQKETLATRERAVRELLEACEVERDGALTRLAALESAQPSAGGATVDGKLLSEMRERMLAMKTKAMGLLQAKDGEISLLRQQIVRLGKEPVVAEAGHAEPGAAPAGATGATAAMVAMATMTAMVAVAATVVMVATAATGGH